MSLKRVFTETKERRISSSFNLIQADWMAAFSESFWGGNKLKPPSLKINQTAKSWDWYQKLRVATIFWPKTLGKDPCITPWSYLLCELEQRPVWRRICSQKLLWGKEKRFPRTCSNILSCWPSHFHQWRAKDICPRLIQQLPEPYGSSINKWEKKKSFWTLSIDHYMVISRYTCSKLKVLS